MPRMTTRAEKPLRILRPNGAKSIPVHRFQACERAWQRSHPVVLRPSTTVGGHKSSHDHANESLKTAIRKTTKRAGKLSTDYCGDRSLIYLGDRASFEKTGPGRHENGVLPANQFAILYQETVFNKMKPPNSQNGLSSNTQSFR